MERILDINPLTGMAVTFQYDHANEQLIIGHRQDATSVVEDNKWKLLDRPVDIHVDDGPTSITGAIATSVPIVWA